MSDVVIPNVGEGGMDIIFEKWLVTEGQWVEPGDDLFELDTAKANVSVQAFASGRVESLSVAEGDEVERGQVVAVLRDGATVGGVTSVTSVDATEPGASQADPTSQPTAANAAAPKRTSPRDKFAATRAAASARMTGGGDAPAHSATAPADDLVPETERDRPAEGAYRRATAASAIASWVQTPHVSATARIGRSWELSDVVASVARALGERPSLRVRWDGIQAIPRAEFGIGILWSTSRGLVQTCLTEQEAVHDSARAIASARERAERGRLRPIDHGVRTINVQWIESVSVDSVGPVLPAGDSLMMCAVHSAGRTLLSIVADQRCIDVHSLTELLDELREIGEGRP